MNRDLTKLFKGQYDVLVVGGGINGAAIAYMAALTGARVALIEKNDFASGTSSKSTKLLHGGIRYLENLEFDLVAESLKERYIQYKNAPHLVKLLSFVVPVYKNDLRPLWMMRLGVWLYDILSGDYSVGRRQTLTAQDLVNLAPSINTKDLTGAVSYYDAQMDDVRICLENVLMAQLKGAHVANHGEVTEFLKDNGKCNGARVKDSLTGKTFDVMARTVVVTAGPWSDELLSKDSKNNRARLRPTKGVHVLYRGQVSDKAFLIQSSDKRVFFIIPFRGHSLIGTTDTDYKGSPDKVSVGQEDIEYLLTEAGRVFPQMVFTADNIITSFAGLRPLVDEKKIPGKISRKHTVDRTFSGIWYVLGGKYTTYRAIARECVQKILPALSRKLPDETTHPLYGSGDVKVDVKQVAARFGVSSETVNYLIGFYGVRYWDVLRLIDDDSSLRVKLCECSPAIRAQAAYAVKTEMACNVDDVYERRLQLQYSDCLSHHCRRSIEDVISTYVV